MIAESKPIESTQVGIAAERFYVLLKDGWEGNRAHSEFSKKTKQPIEQHQVLHGPQRQSLSNGKIDVAGRRQRHKHRGSN